MKTDGNWWTAVLSAGITAGYATTVVQLFRCGLCQPRSTGYGSESSGWPGGLWPLAWPHSSATRLKRRWRNVQQTTGSCAVDSLDG